MFLTRLARLLTTLALLGLAVLPPSCLVQGSYPSPGACSGDCWTHDPSVVKRSDGTYFRFSTGGGIGVYKASSLAGSWTYAGVALSSGSSISVTGNTGTDLWVRVYYLLGFGFLFLVISLKRVVVSKLFSRRRFVMMRSVVRKREAVTCIR